MSCQCKLRSFDRTDSKNNFILLITINRFFDIFEITICQVSQTRELCDYQDTTKQYKFYSSFKILINVIFMFKYPFRKTVKYTFKILLCLAFLLDNKRKIQNTCQKILKYVSFLKYIAIFLMEFLNLRSFHQYYLVFFF